MKKITDQLKDPVQTNKIPKEGRIINHSVLNGNKFLHQFKPTKNPSNDVFASSLKGQFGQK